MVKIIAIIMMISALYAWAYNFPESVQAALQEAFNNFDNAEFELAAEQFKAVQSAPGLGDQERACLSAYIDKAEQAEMLTNMLIALYSEPSEPRKKEIVKGGFIHVVKPGEYLWKIAAYKSYYGNGDKWHVIYEANKDLIDPEENDTPYPGWWIYPGQELIIPMPTNRPYPQKTGEDNQTKEEK